MKNFTLSLAIIICFIATNTVAIASEWQVVVGGESSVVNVPAPNSTDGPAGELGVGLIVVTVPGKGPVPIGTGWLYKSDIVATNGHIATGVVTFLKLLKKEGVKGAVPFYIPNRSKDRSVQIVDIAIHPEYRQTTVDVHGTRPVNSPDVALMALKEKLSPVLTVAPKSTLQNLTPGQPIQYIGFPMENLNGNNVNLHNIIATIKSGTITAISDWWLSDSGAEKNKLIRHDMGSAGGASGSPVFNKDGQVIGLHNAGNYYQNVNLGKDGKQTTRISHAAMINFAVRVDLLSDITF